MNLNHLNEKLIDTPFDPRKCPCFYGWVIVAVATVATIASIPGQTIGVGVFTDFLIKQLNLNRTQLSSAYMIGTLISSILLPFAGNIIDNIGTRNMAVFSSIGLAVSLIAIASSSQVAAFINSDSVLTAFIVVSFCFLLIRFFGQGCLTLVSRVAIGKWFNYRRGLATAVSSLFVSFAFNSSPMLLNNMVQTIGWTNTYFTLAATIGLGISAINWLFFRDNPEQCGLVMDGVSQTKEHRKIAQKFPVIYKQFTRKDALRTLAFWSFSLGTATNALIVTAIVFHITDIGKEFNLSRDQSYQFFLVLAAIGVIANFLGGWLSDRIRLKWLLIAMMLLEILGLAGMFFYNLIWGRWLFAIGMGPAGGLFGILVTVTWPRLYGRQHLGSISGISTSVMVFASAIGPILFNCVTELTHTYRTVIAGSMMLPAFIILLAVFTQNPQEKFQIQYQTNE